MSDQDSGEADTDVQCKAPYIHLPGVLETHPGEQRLVDAEQRDKDRRMAAQGYRYKAVVWVHESDCSRDHNAQFYFKRMPTTQQVEAAIERMGLSVHYQYVMAISYL